ncbi:hypothetical protein BDR03DRAFT_1017643, partial [Suillus americanus]
CIAPRNNADSEQGEGASEEDEEASEDEVEASSENEESSAEHQLEASEEYEDDGPPLEEDEEDGLSESAVDEGIVQDNVVESEMEEYGYGGLDQEEENTDEEADADQDDSGSDNEDNDIDNDLGPEDGEDENEEELEGYGELLLSSVLKGIGSKGLWPQLMRCAPFPSIVPYFRILKYRVYGWTSIVPDPLRYTDIRCVE